MFDVEINNNFYGEGMRKEDLADIDLQKGYRGEFH